MRIARDKRASVYQLKFSPQEVRIQDTERQRRRSSRGRNRDQTYGLRAWTLRIEALVLVWLDADVMIHGGPEPLLAA
jgi:hypothetical protein